MTTAATPATATSGQLGAAVPSLPAVPALVVGTVSHRRRGAARHGFRYGVYQWLVDLDHLPALPWYLRPFSGFHAEDHLGDPALGIRGNVDKYLGLHGIHLGPDGRILMLANARVLGHVFDPLTVFWCLDGDGALVCVVAEVHNTYAERHVYLLRPDHEGRAETDKQFYVSPFNDVSGSYDMRFTLEQDRVGTTIALRRGGQLVFSASLQGRPVPVTRRALVRQLITKPLMPQRVSALIRLHGIWLWLRRLPVVRRPHHPVQKGV